MKGGILNILCLKDVCFLGKECLFQMTGFTFSDHRITVIIQYYLYTVFAYKNERKFLYPFLTGKSRHIECG